MNLTEEENEDSDPGGTSVLRVSCLEYVFGPRLFFGKSTRLNTSSPVERKAAHNEINNHMHSVGGDVP